jgi:DNA-binding response OmpR family regulator
MSAVGKRILVVEDDRFLRRACEATLERSGFQVRSAVDGESALEMVRAEAPDLILLDLLMPKLPGVDVLRALRADPVTRDIRVVILSNSSREQDVRVVNELGIEDYWIKSNISLKELDARVTKLLEEPAPAPATLG